jgi:archaellum biogenesis ATPase FlaH
MSHFWPCLVHVDVCKDLSEDTIALLADGDYWANNQKTRRQLRRDVMIKTRRNDNDVILSDSQSILESKAD